VPYLIYNAETPDAKIYELKTGLNSIGRKWDNTIVITDESLSRHHAEIIIASSGHITIKDEQSKNGTFVNNVRIASPHVLNNGDLVRCGNAVFKLLEDAPTQTTPQPPDSFSSSIIKKFPAHGSTAIQDLVQKEMYGSLIKIKRQNTQQQAVDKLKILLEVSKQLSSPDELDNLLEKILNLLFEIMNVDRAAILMHNEKSDQMELKAVKSGPKISLSGQFYSTSIINLACTDKTTIITSDASHDDRFSSSESVIYQAIHASICIPLKPREEVIGVLYIDNLSLTNLYSDDDVEFLTSLVNLAAIAIDNAYLYEKMQKEAVLRDKLERFFPEAVSRKIREEGSLGIVDTEITALFSDITSFTQMSSIMEPRQVIEMLNEYFGKMVEEIVFPYEGTLEKYIGDALVAVWGSPYAQPDDAERAIRAAIEMQWAVRRLNREWLEREWRPISIHIGLNTGKVAAGNIGSRKLIQYAHIGDTMNVASRICTAAKGGQILISDSTLEKLGSHNFPVEAMEPIMVKGKDEPLQLYILDWQKVHSVLTTKTISADKLS